MSSGNQPFEAMHDEPSFADSMKDVSQMQETPTFTPQGEEELTLFFDLMKKIPFLEDFLRDSDESGEFISSLLDSKNTDAATASLTDATKGFHYAHLGIALMNFIRIPLMYLAAAILGKELPFKLSRLGKLTYSALLVGLAAATIAVPALAATLGLATAGLGLGMAVYLLGRHFYQRSQLGKSLKTTVRAIALDEGVLAEIKEQSQALGEQLQEAMKKGDLSAAKKVSSSIERMKHVFHNTVSQLQHFHNERFQLQEKLQKLNDQSLTDKAVSASLTFTLMIGLALALFFPPVGFGVAAASTALSVAYLAKRFLIPYAMRKIDSFRQKKSVETTEEITSSAEEVEPSETCVEQPAESVHESTTDAIKMMVGQDAAEKLQEQIEAGKMPPEEPPFTMKPTRKKKAPPKDDSEGESEGEKEGGRVEILPTDL